MTDEAEDEAFDLTKVRIRFEENWTVIEPKDEPECEVCARSGLLERTGGRAPLCPKCTDDSGRPVCHVHGDCAHGYAGSILEWRRRAEELEERLAVPQAATDLRDVNDAGIVEVRAEPHTVWVNVDGRCVLRVFPPWPGEDEGRERLRIGLDVQGISQDWWLYVPEEDEAGIVIPGTSAREALSNARNAGWEPGANEVYAYALLGDPVALGIVEPEDEDDAE